MFFFYIVKVLFTDIYLMFVSVLIIFNEYVLTLRWVIITNQ